MPTVALMGRRTTRFATEHQGTPARPAGPSAYDADWARGARSAIGFAALLLGLLVTIDAVAGRFSVPRAAMWAALAAVLFVVLWPDRVRVCAGVLVSHGLLRRRVVHTDRLVSVRWSDGIAQRLVLRDAEGGRAEIDPNVLVSHPQLWHILYADARTSIERGMLCCGETALRQLAARVDRRTVRVVRTSGPG